MVQDAFHYNHNWNKVFQYWSGCLSFYVSYSDCVTLSVPDDRWYGKHDDIQLNQSTSLLRRNSSSCKTHFLYLEIPLPPFILKGNVTGFVLFKGKQVVVYEFIGSLSKWQNVSAQDQMNWLKIVETLFRLRSLKLIVAALFRLIDHALLRTSAFLIQETLAIIQSLAKQWISQNQDNQHLYRQ